MEAPPTRRPVPFFVTLGLAVLMAVLVLRLPEGFVSSLRQNRFVDGQQSDWIYRAVALAAAMQALYVGFVLLRPEQIQRARNKDRKLGRKSRSELLHSISRNAAGFAALTLIYGASAFLITGEREGFWPFLPLLVLQVALYYRRVGEIESWLSFQPEYVTDGGGRRESETRDRPVGHQDDGSGGV